MLGKMRRRRRDKVVLPEEERPDIPTIMALGDMVDM